MRTVEQLYACMRGDIVRARGGDGDLYLGYINFGVEVIRWIMENNVTAPAREKTHARTRFMHFGIFLLGVYLCVSVPT